MTGRLDQAVVSKSASWLLDALKRTVETGAATIGSAILGWLVGTLLGGGWIAWAAAGSAGLNGLFAGLRQLYQWRTVAGWYAFVADSTWALVGTTLGNLVNLLNLVWPSSRYRTDFSRRRNRQLYDGGIAPEDKYAFTMGNVISNADTTGRQAQEDKTDLIELHADLHIWQNRWFGPIYQAMYVFWAVGGALIALLVWVFRRYRPHRRAFRRHRGFRRLIQTAAYYDNPFEYWAYKNQGHWHDNAADATLKWG